MKLATAAIIQREGKFLIARRKMGGVVGGRWEFPGGKVEQDETPEQCLKRELKEELDVDVNIMELFADSANFYETGAYYVQAYVVDYKQGEMRLSEHDEIRWVKPREMKKFDFVGNDRQIVEDIIKKHSFSWRESLSGVFEYIMGRIRLYGKIRA